MLPHSAKRLHLIDHRSITQDSLHMRGATPALFCSLSLIKGYLLFAYCVFVLQRDIRCKDISQLQRVSTAKMRTLKSNRQKICTTLVLCVTRSSSCTRPKFRPAKQVRVRSTLAFFLDYDLEVGRYKELLIIRWSLRSELGYSWRT